MPERPYTILSCSVSLDGYLGGSTQERLVLSNDADLDRVDRVRSECDAILVGAGTVRDDNPRLLVRDPARRELRRARGLADSPTKVTMTRHARLDAASNFFATGDSEKIVYCATPSRGARAPGSRTSPRSSTEAAPSTSAGSARTCTTGACAGSWSRAAAGCTRSSSPRPRPTSCTWSWRRSSSGSSRARRFVGDGRLPVEPRAPRAARGDPADRRRGAAPLRPVARGSRRPREHRPHPRRRGRPAAAGPSYRPDAVAAGRRLVGAGPDVHLPRARRRARARRHRAR